MSPDGTASAGVYYRPEDYLGVARRLLIDVVDVTVVVPLSVLVFYAALTPAPDWEHTPLVFVGPLNFVLDLFWLTGDRDRQALRDKFAGTYVIRKDASPAGSGTVVMRTYMFWGMTFLFKEVRR
jgi:hypothetical protein